MRNLRGIVLALLVVWRVHAQDPAAKAMEYLLGHEAVSGFSGSVLLVKNGETVLRTGIGMANRELAVKNRPETKFRLGSITKQFTAAAILILEQRGMLQVGDTIDKYIPDCPEEWKKVQIHHLLSHTAGVPNYTDDPSYEKEMYRPMPLPALIGRFRNKPLEFEPGTQMKYSNSGYALLGDIVQRTSGLSYEAFLQKNLFEPLHMKNTGYDHFEIILPERASGYRRVGGRFQNAAYLDMSQPYAAGALYSTIDDLHLWDEALSGDVLLPQAALQRMFTPVKNGYGYGWAVEKQAGRRVIWHDGGVNGFSTYLGRIPEDKTLVVLLSNLESVDAEKLGKDLGEILYGREVQVPKTRRQISMSQAVFDRYAGKYVLASQSVITVRRDGNRYLLQAAGQPAFEIFPETETEFFFKAVDGQVTFVREPSGTVNGIVLHQKGKNTPGKRVE